MKIQLSETFIQYDLLARRLNITNSITEINEIKAVLKSIQLHTVYLGLWNRIQISKVPGKIQNGFTRLELTAPNSTITNYFFH